MNSLDAIIGQPGRRAALAEAGRTRAAAFTWERTARETYEVYRRALKPPSVQPGKEGERLKALLQDAKTRREAELLLENDRLKEQLQQARQEAQRLRQELQASKKTSPKGP